MPTQTTELMEVQIKPGQDCFTLREAEVQGEKEGRPKRRVKVTLIAVGPGNTVDKCFYTQECINTGPAFFEGARAFANHISAFNKQVQPERTVEEEIGFYTEVLVEGEKLTGILNIFDGDSLNPYWDRIKGAIQYTKDFPGRNIMGLSIHAAGDAKPFNFKGETWKKVFRFADVKSCDFVTWPARNGEFQAVLSESEKQEFSKEAEQQETETVNEAADIFKTLKDHVTQLCTTGAPGAEETRRIVDSLGTSMKLNKQEAETMDPVNTQPTAPTAGGGDSALSAEAHKMAAENYKKMAEAEADPAKKAAHMEKFQKHSSMSESFGKPAAPAAPAAPAVPVPAAQTEAEAEAARQAEAAKKAESAKDIVESEFKGKYVALLTDGLLEKSGLPKQKQEYFRTVIIEGEKDEKVIKAKLASYMKVELMETNRGGGHGGARQEQIPAGETKPELREKAGIKKILANAKGA